MRIDPSREIRPALKKKATRYGKLEHPYLVALNALSTHHHEEAVSDALLGTPYVEISTGPDGKEIVRHLRSLGWHLVRAARWATTKYAGQRCASAYAD
jgi:hypothetical protein